MPAEDVDLLHRGKRIVDLDVKKRAAGAAGPGGQGRRAARLLPARHLRAARHRARGVRRGQPAADLRPDHRLGSGRAAGDDRGARHQLPVADRRAVSHRLPRPAAGRAAEPGRRLRRRVDVRAAGHRRRALRAGAVRQGAGDRRRDGRRGQHPVADDVDDEVDRQRWRDERESFLLDGGAPFYRTYETSDGKYMAVGAIEPQFFAQLLDGLGLAADEVPNQFDIAAYPQMREIFTERFASKTRDEWTRDLRGHRRMRDARAHLDRGRAERAPQGAFNAGATPTASTRPRPRRGSPAPRHAPSAHRRRAPRRSTEIGW